MRKLMLLAAVLVGCAKSETPPADTAMAPEMLTAEDIAGTWSGTTRIAGTDSVISRWTAMRMTDSTGRLAMEGRADTVAYTVRFDGDSMIVTSAAYVEPDMPGRPRVMFRSVGRLDGATLSGTSVTVLADRPDSVVARTEWSGTRVP